MVGRQTEVSVLYTDKGFLVPFIKKQSYRELNIMALLRSLVLACLRFNINFTERHIRGRNNTLSDKLSRSLVKEFRALEPLANATPQEIPYSVSTAGLENLCLDSPIRASVDYEGSSAILDLLPCFIP